MHALPSYRGNRPTNKHTNPQTNKQTNKHDRLQYTVPLSLARSVKMNVDNKEFAGKRHKLHISKVYSI